MNLTPDTILPFLTGENRVQEAQALTIFFNAWAAAGQAHALADERDRQRDEWRKRKQKQRESGNCHAMSRDVTGHGGNSIINTKEDSEKKTPRSRDVTGHGGTSLSPACRELWDAYPTKGRTRSSLKETWEVWRKEHCESIAAEVMRGLAAFKVSDEWRRDNGLAIPGVHRWLKNRRWEGIDAPVKRSIADGLQLFEGGK